MFRTKRLLMFLSASLALLLIFTSAMADESAPAAAADASEETTIETIAAYEGVFSRTSQNVGTVYFPITANIKYEGQQGIFQDFTVRRGDFVEEGQVIATVLVEGDGIDRTNALLTLQRTREAYEKGCLDYEESIQQAYQVLSAATDSYEQEMQLLRIRLLESQYAQYCYQQEYSIARQEEELGEPVPANTVIEVTAPISGYVEDLLSIRSETLVGDGWVLGSISSIDAVLLSVPNESGTFRYGMDVTVSTGSGKEPTYYPGKVVASDNALPQAQRDGVAYVAVEYDPAAINPAALRNISIKGETMRIENAFLLPRSAVASEGKKYYVTLYEDGMMKKRYVLVGDNTPEASWILVGVEAGDQIVDN